MFLRSNARAAGLVDRGEPLQATYVTALEAGAVVGVVAHCWNGMVLVQAPAQVAALARDAVRRSGRAVTGFSGPWTPVVSAREGGGLARGGGQAGGATGRAVRRSEQCGRAGSVPGDRLCHRGGLWVGAVRSIGRGVGEPDAPIDALHPRVGLEQLEERIALRVHED